MLNGKIPVPIGGYIIGLVLGAGLVLLANILLAPDGTTLEDVTGLTLFLAIGGCLLFWWYELRRQ
jgi:hypothetical protein